ncbi:MAG: efflux RND transporter periplasmic adaptor subunit [Nitrospira sp.]|jgi:cobalt-zinc-cadmium efflux system membrane fusion protein|nr:efflux RND transporter periplasmic adaptor subunit [Nitrospira sp.]
MTSAQSAPLTLAVLLLLTVSGCGRTDQPSHPDSAAVPSPPSAGSLADAQSRVETAVVDFSSSHQALTLSGKVAYGEDRYSKISSPLQGRVVEVRVHLGDRVKAGDVLLVVDSPDIAQAYSEYVKEDSDLQYATRAHELAKDLYENKAMPLKDLKQAENELVKARAEFRRAKERLLSLRVPAEELTKPLDKQKITSRFEMKSSLTGVVVERAVTPGQSVGGDPAQVLFTVADLDMLQVLADLYERDLALVKEGQFARVSVEAYPGIDFPATLAAIGDVVDPATRTIKVRAWVNNEAHKLKPEMFARLHLDVGEASQFIVVPREAVLEADGKQFVYVVEDQNRYVKREVKVANISSEQVRVLEGLARGQRIVTKGAVLIKGQEVKGF